MNQNKERLIWNVVSLGGVLLALRLRLYIVAVDEKNLLVSGHWVSLLIWAVAALCLGLALVAAFRAKEEGTLTVGGPVAALGDGLFAGVLCLSMLAMGEPVSILEKARTVLGYLCVPSLLYAAVCRVKGKPVFFGCFCVVCVFFALYLVGIYRVWSSCPQLQDYVFAMLALVGVTSFAYQNAALAVGLGSHRVWLASGLMTIGFGIAAIQGGAPMLLYIGASGWAVTGLLGGEKTEEA